MSEWSSVCASVFLLREREREREKKNGGHVAFNNWRGFLMVKKRRKQGCG